MIIEILFKYFFISFETILLLWTITLLKLWPLSQGSHAGQLLIEMLIWFTVTNLMCLSRPKT